MQKPALTRSSSVVTSEQPVKTAESVLKSIPENKVQQHEISGFPQDIIIQSQPRHVHVMKFY